MIHWYKRAARQGHAGAMFMLGAIYDDHRIKDYDEVESVKGFIPYSEARYGHSFRTAYPNVVENLLDVTDEDLEEAERRAKAWKADWLY